MRGVFTPANGLPLLSCYTVIVGAGTVTNELNYGAHPAGFYITGVVTNVPDQEAATALLMPNPVHQGFAIIRGLHNGQVRATIIDAAGRVVFSALLNVAGGGGAATAYRQPARRELHH